MSILWDLSAQTCCGLVAHPRVVNHLLREEIISVLKEADADTIFSIAILRLNRFISGT